MIWIFGYGSLTWRPDFVFAEQRTVRVDGWVRRFWQASPDHRGTPEQPGRVVTLLRYPGRSAVGVAYRVEGEADAILAQLDLRERAGYQRQSVPMLERDGAVVGDGLTWIAPPHNPNFVGTASLDDMAAQIRAAAGESGPNRDYVLKLADTLRELGADPGEQVFALEERLR